MNLREVVKERRNVLGISQLDLAEMADISLATVKDIERGAGNPSMKTVTRILEVLGLEIFFLKEQIERLSAERNALMRMIFSVC